MTRKTRRQDRRRVSAKPKGAETQAPFNANAAWPRDMIETPELPRYTDDGLRILREWSTD